MDFIAFSIKILHNKMKIQNNRKSVKKDEL